MKVRLEKILDAQMALSELARKDLKIATAYKVAKLIKAVAAEVELFNEQRIKLLQSVGSTLSEDGKQYIIPSDKKAEFAQQFSELVAVEVDVPDKINISGEDISIAPDLLMAIEDFIEIEV
jgi:hypothetical protein